MQAPQPAQATPAQIQLQIENTHWQEKEQTIQNNWSRVESERQQHIDHEHYMVDHLASPIMFVCIVAIIGFVVAYIWRKSLAADIEKNRDDNAGTVREANRLLAEADRPTIETVPAA